MITIIIGLIFLFFLATTIFVLFLYFVATDGPSTPWDIIQFIFDFWMG